MHGDEAAGLLAYQESDEADYLHMLKITVLPHRRRQGVGTGLVKKMQEHASALHRYVRADNTLVPVRSILTQVGFWVACELRGRDGPEPIFKWSDKDEYKNNYVPGLDEEDYGHNLPWPNPSS
jgi:GNAT superfamily N-acetyltransferase